MISVLSIVMVEIIPAMKRKLVALLWLCCGSSSTQYLGLVCSVSMRGCRGDRGSGPLLKNHKNIGLLSNTGPDPLKIIKLPSQHSMLGHHRHASEMPFQWRFVGGPMMALL